MIAREPGGGHLLRAAIWPLIALGAAACQPSKTPAVPVVVEISQPMLAGETAGSPPYLVESSSAVIPANPASAHCPGGRVFLAASDYAHGKPAQLYASRDLSCLDQPGCFRTISHELAGSPGVEKRGTYLLQKNPEPGPDGRCLHQASPAGYTEQPTFPSGLAGTDQLVLSATNAQLGPEGRLFHLWQGSAKFPPAVPNVDVSAWRGGDAPAGRCDVPLIRVGLFVRFSDDCGESWSEPTFINFAELPRADGTPYGMERLTPTGYHPRGPGLYYGTDRPEIYADPFDPQKPLYVSADVALPQGRFDVILRSLDGGVTWATAHNFPDFAGGPKLLTSTPGGRLYVLRCLGQYDRQGHLSVYPELTWFDRGGSRLLGRVWAPHVRDGEKMQCRRAEPRLMQGEPGGIMDVSLSRGAGTTDEDVLRVIYDSASSKGGPQSLYMSVVSVPRQRECPRSGECARVENGFRFDPPPGFSAFHVHAVDPTVALPPERYVSLVHFQLWGPPGQAATPMAFLLRDQATVEGPRPISAPWMPNLGGRRFVGDYNYGSFFLPSPEGNALGYLIQWPESQSTITAPNLLLRHRLLIVRPSP